MCHGNFSKVLYDQNMLSSEVQKYSDELNKLGINHEAIEHPELKTPPTVLGYLGLGMDGGVSTLVMKIDDRFVVLLRRDDCHIDFSRIRRLLGVKSVRIATPEEYKKVTGLSLGAARCYLPDFKTYVDKKVLEREYLIGGSGSFTVSFRYKTTDFGKLPGVEVVDVADVLEFNQPARGLVEAVKGKLIGSKVEYQLIPLPELPLDVGSHVKFHDIKTKEAVPTLIYKTERGTVAAQRRADTKVDDKKLKAILGVKRLSLVSEQELRALGAEPGAVPSTGMALPYYVDRRVMELDVLYGGGGDRKTALRIAPEDLVKINKAKVEDFAEIDFTVSEVKKRILTGDTPTGKLHLGHYVGTLENRVRLQNEFDTFIILADLHSFTTLSEYPDKVRDSTYQVALDNLAVGLDPKKVHIFIESQIPEIYGLAAIYSMLISHNRAMRNPTIKDEIKMKGLGDQYSMGFINYPMYQAADITCVGANLVPVGKDQLPHIEQTREIVDKFNQLYGPVLVKPEGLVGKVGKLVGTDGSPKMSKSLGNTIMLSDSPAVVKERVMNMFTDPTRIHQTDPGHVERNPLFMYHEAFNPDKAEVEEFKERYRKGTVGDVEVKEKLVKVLNSFLDPVRKRRTYYEEHPDEVMDILREGTKITRMEAQKTLEKVRVAMRMNYDF